MVERNVPSAHALTSTDVPSVARPASPVAAATAAAASGNDPAALAILAAGSLADGALLQPMIRVAP